LHTCGHTGRLKDTSSGTPEAIKTDYLKAVRSLGVSDVKNVIRDPFLKWVIPAPFLMAIGFRLLIPGVAALAGPWIVLNDYYPLLLSTFLLFVPLMYGIVVGFMLLDERDEDTLTALKVTPMSLGRYLLYRVTTPILVSIVTTLLAYPIIGLISVDLLSLIAVVVLASLSAPFTALIFAAFARNKVEGMAIQKMLGGVFMIPMIAYFIHSDWQLLFGIFPTYWTLKAFWVASEGGPGLWLYILAGILVHLAFIGVLMKRFDAVMHR
jgi:fluoroquinolone transport system permease protein